MSDRGISSSRLRLALLSLVLFCGSCSPLPAQDLTGTSGLPDPLWTTLLGLTDSLPNLIDSYSSDWTKRLQTLTDNNNLLTANVQSLQISTGFLQDSNDRLQTSNNSLTLENGQLRTSLSQSQADLATSEAERARFRSALDDSLQSITQAQGDAKALEWQKSLWKAGCFVLGAVALGEGAYLAGHLLLKW